MEISANIVRLAWAYAETVRQRVYLNCLKLVAKAPECDRETVAKRYLTGAMTAVVQNGKDAGCPSDTPE